MMQGTIPFPAWTQSGPVRQLAQSVQEFARGLQQGAGKVTATAQAAQSVWKGAASEAFVKHSQERSKTISETAEVLGRCAPILQTYAAAIDSSKAAYQCAVIAEMEARACLPVSALAIAAAIKLEGMIVAGFYGAGTTCAAGLAGVEFQLAVMMFTGVDKSQYESIKTGVIDTWEAVKEFFEDGDEPDPDAARRVESALTATFENNKVTFEGTTPMLGRNTLTLENQSQYGWRVFTPSAPYYADESSWTGSGAPYGGDFQTTASSVNGYGYLSDGTGWNLAGTATFSHDGVPLVTRSIATSGYVGQFGGVSGYAGVNGDGVRANVGGALLYGAQGQWTDTTTFTGIGSTRVGAEGQAGAFAEGSAAAYAGVHNGNGRAGVNAGGYAGLGAQGEINGDLEVGDLFGVGGAIGGKAGLVAGGELGVQADVGPTRAGIWVSGGVAAGLGVNGDVGVWVNPQRVGEVYDWAANETGEAYEAYIERPAVETYEAYIAAPARELYNDWFGPDAEPSEVPAAGRTPAAAGAGGRSGGGGASGSW
jgi:uncharacterized protein YukE